ncbi:rad50 [Carabus blaptoides fortunei]
MSKLMRMQLSGIRSFGPDEDDVQNIRFYTPLTLIQGQNGCGKTTIIEAIKFAITGDLPGGTAKGQGFVYDPKLARSFETRGQVKLKVSNARGESVTVTKLVCVSQKASKLEFKRLDSSISRGTNNGTGHLSGKCADIDNEMCLVLGVSKPVLNNVIFCHQEDSNWPLDESKKLKEKFDDIFDATKYNKCLETINKYVKKNIEKQKILKIEVSNLSDIKKYVEQKRDSLREKETKLDQINKEIEEVMSEFQPLNNRITELDNLEMNYNKLYTDVVFKQKELSHLKEQQEEILRTITEFTGSDEELQGKVTTFEVDLSSLVSDIKVLETKKQDIEEIEKKLRSNINDQNMKLGELQSEEKQNALKIKNRYALLSKTVNDFDLKNVSVHADVTNEQAKIIVEALQNKLDANKSDVVNMENVMESEEKNLQNDIDKIRENCAKLKQNIDSKNKQLNEFRAEIREVQHKTQELNMADDQLNLVDSKLTRIDKELSALQASVDTDALRASIESEKQKYNKMDERLSVVDGEIQSLQHYTMLQTELDLKKENSINRENELQKLQNKHETKFKHIFPDGIPSSDLKNKVETYQKHQAQCIRDLNKEITDKQRDVMRLESKLNVQRDKLREQESELNTNKMNISLQCAEKQLETVIGEISGQSEKLQNQRGVYYSSSYLYQKFIANFQVDNPNCPICKRRVEEKEYAVTVIEDLRKKIENFPSKIRKMDMEISENNSRFQKLLALKPVNEKIKKLEETVPKLKEEVKYLETHLSTATEELKDLKNKILIPQKNEVLANSVMGDATLIDQHERELSKIKQEIMSLSSRIPHNESSRGMQEAITEQESLRIDIRTARSNVESQRNKLSQHTERLQKQKEFRNELISQKLSIRKNLQDKDHLVAKRADLENKIVELDDEYKNLQTQVEPLKKELNEAIRTKDEEKTANRNKLEQSRSRCNNLKRQLDDIMSLQTAITDFHYKNIAKQIDLVNESVNKYKDKLNMYSKKKIDIHKNVDDLKVQITNSKVYFREMQDNLNLREKRKQAAKLENELTVLNEQLGDKNSASIRRDRMKLKEKEDNLQKKKNFAQGKKDQLKESIAEVSNELTKPQNMRASYNYKRKFLELKLHERASNDLKEFVKGMDWSLMQFHKQRMIQINNIVKELWRSIYKGNDCDYIEIKTDDISVLGSDKRKMYNYRVVQVKNGIELDMRGRCSAGQRVLASLIIRIALADTFSTNCGILALDEPTTNLDRENIHSLSEALVDLVTQKRQQKNFQLLIITHDQEFVDRLTRVESLDNYYVITRNELGKSTISTHNR